MYIYGVHGCRRRTASRSRPSRLYNLIDPLDPAPTIPQGLEEFDPIPPKKCLFCMGFGIVLGLVLVLALV